MYQPAFNLRLPWHWVVLRPYRIVPAAGSTSNDGIHLVLCKSKYESIRIRTDWKGHRYKRTQETDSQWSKAILDSNHVTNHESRKVCHTSIHYQNAICFLHAVYQMCNSVSPCKWWVSADNHLHWFHCNSHMTMSGLCLPLPLAIKV